MLATVHSAALQGIDAMPITVELDLGTGFPAFNIVGLADTAVQESRERVKSAIRNSGLPFPTNHRLIMNLAPADIKKSGPLYDLPIAIAILKAHVPLEINLNDSLFVGEVALDGAVRPVHGVLPIALYARKAGFMTVYVPQDNAKEAACVPGIKVIPVASIKSLIDHLTEQNKIVPTPKTSVTAETAEYPYDLRHIKGQFFAKRALEIAAAGAHNLLFSGPPGAGKTFLARTLPSILPPMTEAEILEVTKIYSVAGLVPGGHGLITARPFRTPHHSASAISIIGGGGNPKPGEVSLAHRGVLFLDEAPEFPRGVLEHLRQPLEDGHVTITRVKETVKFPARFTMIMSQNPCPCGYYGDPHHQCICTTQHVMNYQKKLSGPLLDRIDMLIEVPAVEIEELTEGADGEPSASVRERVTTARERQTKRFEKHSPSPLRAKSPVGATPLYGGEGRGEGAQSRPSTPRSLCRTPILCSAQELTHTNSEMSTEQLKQFCKPEDDALNMLKTAATQMHLSARAFHRILKVSRTIADLAGDEKIKTPHIAEALQFREKK